MRGKRRVGLSWNLEAIERSSAMVINIPTRIISAAPITTKSFFGQENRVHYRSSKGEHLILNRDLLDPLTIIMP